MPSDRKSRFDYKGPINKNWNKKPKRTLDRPKPAAPKAAAPKPGKPKRLAGALGAGPPAATKPKAKPKKGRKIIGYKMNLDGSDRTPVYEPDFSRAVGSKKKARRS